MTNSPEFSRLIAVDALIADKPRTDKFEATPAECAALCKRLDLKSLTGFKGKITTLRVSEGKIIQIEGDIEADIVQTCVVSLQDVPAEIKVHFDTYFTEDGSTFDQDQEFSIELETDLHDVMQNGMIDLGELMSQHLSLELDPYPRAPGVSLAAQLAEVGTEVKNRPFQVLEGLKKDKEE